MLRAHKRGKKHCGDDDDDEHTQKFIKYPTSE